jgi:hypothetical protein
MSKKQNSKPTITETSPTENTPIKAPFNANWVYFGLTLVFLAVLFSVRYRLLNIPMTRDEGSYAYLGQLLLEGKRPYVDFYEMKPPGIFYGYAAIIAIFGKTIKGVHFGFAILNMLTAFLVGLIAKKWFDSMAAMAATVAFGILSLGMFAAGTAAQSEYLVTFFAMLGIYLTIKAIETEKIWQFILSGLALGMAVMVKQTGGVFALAAGIIVILTYIKPFDFSKILKNALWMLLGFGGMIGIFVALMMSKGVYNDMNHWIFEMPKAYLTYNSTVDGINYFKDSFGKLTDGYWALWILGIASIFTIWLTDLVWSKKIGTLVVMLLGFAAVTPGLRFFAHYYQLLMPGLALGIGASVYSLAYILKEKFNFSFGKTITTAVFLGIAIFTMIGQNNYYFSMSETAVTRKSHGDTPYIEVKAMADYIEKNSEEKGPIAVFSADPQVYFQTQRACPHRHSFISFTSPMTDQAKGFREEIKAAVKESNPEFVLVTMHPNCWAFPDGSDHDLFNWALDFAIEKYTLVGAADIGNKSQIFWEEEARKHKVTGMFFVYLFKRNKTAK